MRKQLGLLASLIFLSATALFWTGCSGSRYSNDCCDQSVCVEPCQPTLCKPVCPQPCNPVCEPCPQLMECPPCPPCPPCAPRQICPPPCPPPCAPKQMCPPPCPPRNECPPPCQVRQECPPPCAPPCPPPCAKPVCPEPCAPRQACPPPCEDYCPPKCAPCLKPCKYGPSGECACNGITVRAKNPKMCMLGDQYPLDMEVIACCDVCEATVTTTLPDGVTFMRSQPEARVDGRKVVWEFGHLGKGQTVPVRVWLKCEREGDLCTCFCVKATPVAFCALLCAKPVLVCEKCAPEQVCPGDPINYTITVTNIGTCPAEEVVVRDTLPAGVEHPSCQKDLVFKLGTLEPCQTKKVNFSVTACKRGKICNTATVTACNANQTSCEACTCVCCCAVECEKAGPQEIAVGQNADYQITVVNTGDLPLHDVVVTDTAPSATSIVSAAGANICGKQAVWKLKELRPGEKVTFNITLTTCTPGYFTNRVTVTDCEGCNSCCEAGTKWKGRPALESCVSILDNPICVGETSRFKIIVQNKGQEYDSNVNVVVTLPSELTPVEASGATAGRIQGNTVTYAPFSQLAPRQTLEYYLTVKANGRGDLRPKIQVSSDFIKNPITEEESLIVN
jgi:uncharacterized repeat protein (TIGR01451 family)